MFLNPRDQIQKPGIVAKGLQVAVLKHPAPIPVPMPRGEVQSLQGPIRFPVQGVTASEVVPGDGIVREELREPPVHFQPLRDLPDPRVQIAERAENTRMVRTPPGQGLQKIPLDPQGSANPFRRHGTFDYGAEGSTPSLRM